MLLGAQINHTHLTIACLLLAALVTGCKKIDPAVEIPSYIEIPAFDVQSTYLTQGTDAHQISDAWVLVNDSSIGAYELPATIPILANGKTDISLGAGIQVNGISTDRRTYPFYRDTVLNVELVPGESVTLSPTVTYFSNINFAWLEDFEIGSSLESSYNQLTLEKVSTLAEFGDQSAVIRPTAADPYYFGNTDQQSFIINPGYPVFVELQYASNINFAIGAIKTTVNLGVEVMAPHYVVFPSSNWNKIYLDMTDYLRVETDAYSFELYIDCAYNSEAGSNYIYLDNLKFIYN